jgi:hypothetical protein
LLPHPVAGAHVSPHHVPLHDPTAQSLFVAQGSPIIPLPVTGAWAQTMPAPATSCWQLVPA